MRHFTYTHMHVMFSTRLYIHVVPFLDVGFILPIYPTTDAKTSYSPLRMLKHPMTHDAWTSSIDSTMHITTSFIITCFTPSYNINTQKHRQINTSIHQQFIIHIINITALYTCIQSPFIHIHKHTIMNYYHQ